MRKCTILFLLLITMAAETGLARGNKKGKLLYLTLSAGFKHGSVPLSRDIVKEIGDKSGAFETTLAEDVTPFTAENLKNYDAVMFYTTGELPMTDEQKNAFIHFIKSGHGFVGVHSATDTFYMWKEYGDLIGGYFNGHPWHQEVAVDVADPTSPLVSSLDKSFQIKDEIYQIDDFRDGSSHVLLKLDPKSVDLKKPGVHQRYYGWPLAWTRMDGRGRVFYTALGHEDAVWKDERFQKFLLNGIKWAMREK